MSRINFLVLIYHTSLLVSAELRISLDCPVLCECFRDDKSSEVWSKVKCSRQGIDKLIIEDINLGSVEPPIIQLDLSQNGISELHNSFLTLDELQKLDLSKNDIEKIDVNAFKFLKKLKRLDLSHNKIKELRKEIFESLNALEALKLNSNLILHLWKGVFDPLLSLKNLDISENPFDCDCINAWVAEWSKNNSIKVRLPKCRSPPSSKGKPFRKLKFHCDEESVLHSDSNGLELKPMHNQIVFEGDSLSLRCRSFSVGAVGSESRDTQVTWSWKNKDPASYFNKIKIENKSFTENGYVESQLKIDRIQKSHSGDWYCHLLSEMGNHSTAISVIVLSEDSKYCPQTDTRNNKGVYFWPKTIVGFTVDLPCAVSQPSIVGNKEEPRAIYFCNDSGSWENLNTTFCPYVSETTRILEQFSQVNLSIAKGSVLDSSLKLKNFTGNGKNLTDPMDVVFISKTIENYLMFVKSEKDLGYILVDIISTIMQLPKTLLLIAQRENSACSRLVQSIELICKDIPTFQTYKNNLAVEAFGVSGVFSGIRCVWYIKNQNNRDSKRFFYCSTNNKTVLPTYSDKTIEASIQIPASLFSQLELQGKSTHNIWQLIVSMYDSNSLFPVSPNAHEDVTSCVVGTTLVGVEVSNLTEPVYIMLRVPSPSSYSTSATPVWWDQSLNNGSGQWSLDGCQLSHTTHDMIVFYCNRFGYYGLLQDSRYLNDFTKRYGRVPLCHPAIYTGSFILILCLIISIATYFKFHNFIQMSRRAKHSIVNTWISICFLCFLFSCGIYQTENAKICQIIGIVLHYLFLSTLLWMSVSVSNMYKRLSKPDHLDSTPEDDLPTGAPIQKPILGLYLVGWGIGLIVCGISGAVNLKEYAGRSFCFLESGPALSAVYVPAGILLVFLILFYILTFCAIRNNDMNGQLSEGTQGTENVDLELLEVPTTMGCMNRRSCQSIVATDSDDVEDPEHSPLIQLKAHIIVLFLYCCIWVAAALSLTDNFRIAFPYQEDICSVVYCILAFCLGAFILYFYCVARSDVRSQWTTLRKVFKGNQIYCCRNRGISDSNRNLRVNPPAALPDRTEVRTTLSALSSSSINSSGLTAKSNSHNGNRVKAVKKLNNCESRDDQNILNTNASNNVNLVAMHRQLYRSNNSVPTYHEIGGPDCVEAFYNPRQSIVARKFFKKQRRNKRMDLGLRRRGDGGGTSEGEVSQARRTWRPSAESAVFLSSDMENASEKIGPSLFAYGSKVNNTNIHVGSVGKRQKSISPKNPNLLTDSDEENRNKLPLDRLVIGAEETGGSVKNSDKIPPYDYALSRVDEISVSEEIATEPNSLSDEKIKSGNGVLKTENFIVPDYRTVELQCNLGEHDCSDCNFEIECYSSINSDEECDVNSSLHKSCQANFSTSNFSDGSGVDSRFLDSKSFCEKIDRFQFDISKSDFKLHKTESSNFNDSDFSTTKDTYSSSSVPVSEKKRTNRLSLPTAFEIKQENIGLDKDNSEKNKLETSV